MIDTQEPKDGDFIAYVERLQKESAERLLGSGHPLINQLDKTQPKGDGHFFAGRKPADLRSQAELRAALSQVAASAPLSRLFSAVLSITIGVLLTLYWLLASASVALLVVGIALMIWGVQRVKRAVRQFSPQQGEHARALVAKAFHSASKPK